MYLMSRSGQGPVTAHSLSDFPSCSLTMRSRRRSFVSPRMLAPAWASPTSSLLLGPILRTGPAVGRATRLGPGLRGLLLGPIRLTEQAVGRATRLGPGLRGPLLGPILLKGQAVWRATRLGPGLPIHQHALGRETCQDPGLIEVGRTGGGERDQTIRDVRPARPSPPGGAWRSSGWGADDLRKGPSSRLGGNHAVRGRRGVHSPR